MENDRNVLSFLITSHITQQILLYLLQHVRVNYRLLQKQLYDGD